MWPWPSLLNHCSVPQAPQQAQSPEAFYSVSPAETPHGSPLRPREPPEAAAPVGRKEGVSNPLASPVSVSAGWERTTSEGSSDDSGCDESATDAASRRSLDSMPPGRGDAGSKQTGDLSRPAVALPLQREQARELSQARRQIEEAAANRACFALAAAGAREVARPALQDRALGESRGPFQVTYAPRLRPGGDVFVLGGLRAHASFTRSRCRSLLSTGSCEPDRATVACRQLCASDAFAVVSPPASPHSHLHHAGLLHSHSVSSVFEVHARIAPQGDCFF